MRKLDDALDKALEETFPASDPIAVGTPTGTEPLAPVDRKAPKAGQRPASALSRRA